MIFTTLIQPDELAATMQSDPARSVVCDCRFDLMDHAAGPNTFAAGHIPGAAYLHLEEVLSGAKTGRNGRHPLPARDTLAAVMAELGAGPETQVVGYDAADGMFAARLWWLIRWLGHERVAVLDGGLAAWQRAGYETSAAAPPARPRGTFTAQRSLVSMVDYAALREASNGTRLIVDARAPDRFRGENETLDPIGGHIPGARNRFFRNNLDPQGRFRPAAELRENFQQVLRGQPATAVVSQCGSGVTAAHNLLAMEIAGLPGAALYPGSWSEWSAQPGAPVATGPS